MTPELLERIRLFLLGDHMRFQMPSVARMAAETAWAVKAGHADPRRIRKALMSIDLSKESTARAERAAIIAEMRGRAFVPDRERPVEGAASPSFTDTIWRECIEQLGMKYGRRPFAQTRKYVFPDGTDATADYSRWLEIFRSLFKDPPRIVTPERREAGKAPTLMIMDSIGHAADDDDHRRNVLAEIASSTGPEIRIKLEAGQEKTLLSLLAPLHVSGCRIAVRYVAPGLLPHYRTIAEHEAAKGTRLPSVMIRHWLKLAQDGPVLHVLSLATLNRPEASKEFDEIRPDLIILDEDVLRHPGTTRDIRLMKCLTRNPRPRLLVWS